MYLPSIFSFLRCFSVYTGERTIYSLSTSPSMNKSHPTEQLRLAMKTSTKLKCNGYNSHVVLHFCKVNKILFSTQKSILYF